MICKNCGDTMDGDGYKSPFRCPNVNRITWAFEAPDSNAFYCDGVDIRDRVLEIVEAGGLDRDFLIMAFLKWLPADEIEEILRVNDVHI